jgi:1-acyl-sn-glycerol-3-phosphate acyltransferase
MGQDSIRPRVAIALVIIGLHLCLSDLVQRGIVSLLLRLFPSSRDRLLSAWFRYIANATLSAVRRLAGARWTSPPRIPLQPGILILMNHQSLLDIPLSVKALDDGYLRIVTRRRYTRGIPLISHMVRLYRFPVVDPGTAREPQLQELRRMASDARYPLLIYPEGHRTRDGEIGPFKRGGLEAILGVRSWRVYLLVIDGFWRTARLSDFLRRGSDIRGQIEWEGPFNSPEPGEDVDAWIDSMRERMCLKLKDMRSRPPRGSTSAEAA